MQFNILPPDNYDTSGKTKYAVLLAMHPDFDGMNGSSYKTGSNFVNGTAYVGGTQSLNSLFNNNAFRADFPAIVIAPQCYQPGSDTVDNFGGYGDEDDSGGNEQGLLAIFAALLAGQIPGIAAASINPDLIVGWGYSLGAIGILAMLLDNPLNNPPAGGKPLLAAAVGMSDQISRAGVTNSSFFVRLEATPYFAISTSSDNNPASVDEPLWQSITGNQKWPTEAQYNSGGVASCRAGISDFYYINVGSGDPTNPFAMLKANGGNGDAIFQWLFGVVGGGVTTIPSNGATPMTATLSGTVITPTSGGSITDSIGDVYSMTAEGPAPGGTVYLNGAPVSGGAGTSQCIMCGGTCYAQDAASSAWYTLVGTTFTPITGTPPCTAAVPGAPGTPVVGVITDTSVALSWAANTTGGASFIYELQYSSDGGVSWSMIAAQNPTGLTDTVSPLKPGTAYQFQVAGVNATGPGAFSASASAVTSSSTNPPPPGVTVASVQAQITNAESLIAILQTEMASIFTNVGLL
jgi:hypothetical protein